MRVVFYRGRYQAACRFGVRSQAACLLESLRFWSPINKGLQTPWGTFLDVSAFGALLLPFFSRIFFAATSAATVCSALRRFVAHHFR